MPILDVIVVGAGPAGNRVALDLARAGHAVSVIDYRLVPGDKLCTGIVSASCLRDFPPAGPVVYQAGRSATVVSPSGRPVRFQRDEAPAYVIDRVAYVRGIAEQAQTAGASYQLGWYATDLRTGPSGALVTLTQHGRRRTVEASMVVVATGFNPLLATKAGFGKVSDYAIGAQAEVFAPHVQEVQVYLGNTFAPGFFGWLAPTRDGRALLGLLSRRHAKEGLGVLLAKLKRLGVVLAVLKAPSAWGVPLYPIRQTVADRVLVVGDAAGQVKPTTGGGIYYALLAGRIAAKTIKRAILVDDFSAESLLPYEAEWSSLLAGELAIGARLRAIGERLSDRQMEQALGLIGSNPLVRGLLASGTSFDWHGRLARRLVGVLGMDFRAAVGVPDLRRRLRRAIT